MNTISFFLYNILGEVMNYEILVNKDNLLDKTYIPDDLVMVKGNYKDGILLNEKALEHFNLIKGQNQFWIVYVNTENYSWVIIKRMITF